MRPKVVLMLLVVVLGLVVAMALFRASVNNKATEMAAPTETNATPNTAPVAKVQPAGPGSTNTAEALEKQRLADLEKELDSIRELQAEGAPSPTSTAQLLVKVIHPEAEVRKAALEALVQLNDTNAIPGLEQAVGQLEDPRDKTAVLDALTYLKLPESTGDLPTGVSRTAAESREKAKALRAARANSNPRPRTKGAVPVQPSPVPQP